MIQKVYSIIKIWTRFQINDYNIWDSTRTSSKSCFGVWMDSIQIHQKQQNIIKYTIKKLYMNWNTIGIQL